MGDNSKKLCITIEFTPPGAVQVTYPVKDSLTVLGLLDVAMERVLRQMFGQAVQSTGRILPVDGILNIGRGSDGR